jgi:hypothetical protein
MNRARLANIGSGYFHQIEASTAFVTGALDCRARHAYLQRQAEDIFMSSFFLSCVNPSKLPDF